MKPDFFTIRKGKIFAIPVLHYTMEMASFVKMAFHQVNPDCVAVELAETMQSQLLHAAGRLPDISVVTANDPSLHYLCEPCDPCFEGLRSALEHDVAAYCIDLDVEDYPLFKEGLPDPYASVRIGLKQYYASYLDAYKDLPKHALDVKRELYMAKRLKELSFSHEAILFVGGFYHVHSVLSYLERNEFPEETPPPRKELQISTLTESSCRNVLAEYAWITTAYELWRRFYEKEAENLRSPAPLDRQKLIYQLYKKSAALYRETTGHAFPGYHMRNTMKYVRNYALLHKRLLPDLYQILTAAKGCVDHNYAYEVWLLATNYPHLRNVDNLKELDLSVEEVWGMSKKIHFHLKQKSRKGLEFQKRKKDAPHARFHAPSPFSICSYPPEDIIVEKFGEYLKKKGTLLLSEEGTRVAPFTTSLEGGIDVKETLRHFVEKKLYVKLPGRPPGSAGSVVVIFDEQENSDKYPWKTTWLGEHHQESDMAFYATSMAQNIVGPGISRCEYGGFMLSSPPQRLWDIWNDPDYAECVTKADHLLMAAIDYSVKPVIVYIADKPPRSKIKGFASRYGKKVIYIPKGQLSPVLLNKIRVFHVLDGRHKREIAGEYIFD